MTIYILYIFLSTPGGEYMALPIRHYANIEICREDKKDIEQSFHNVYGDIVDVEAFGCEVKP
jgi:hypothetical protein